ncbi:MAG: hypothetical protein H6841_03285 [Planctomycetes bacterium]|nr:hypothetical protein [Planctomycetota bacterium]MCB9934142.1 hypothetical protein [Planctomycetota bacterium]
MKTKTLFCALALLAMIVAAEASAEAQKYSPHRTTVQQLTESAEVVIVGQLDRVDDIDLTEVGIDAAVHKRLNDGKIQDGQDYVRREAVLKVNTVLKGDPADLGSELRFVSIRQLKLENYDLDLRSGEAIYFLSKRPEDGRYVVLSDERGTVSTQECAGDLQTAVTYVRSQIEHGVTGTAAVERMLNAIALDGSRLSVDSAIELSWHHETYAPDVNAEHRNRILGLGRLSAPGSEERNQLLTAMGRMPAEGALEALLEIMLTDANWSTTSLASMSLEYVDRGQAISRLLSEYELAQNDTTRMVIVRSLGLIRPKLGYDGADLRNRTLNLVKGLLNAGTDKNLLREALIASRDLRSEDAHTTELKALIDARETNGLTGDEVNAAIVALAAGRTTDAEGNVNCFAKDYLLALGEADPVLDQVVKSAMKFPYTTLILGADGKGH